MTTKNFNNIAVFLILLVLGVIAFYIYQKYQKFAEENKITKTPVIQTKPKTNIWGYVIAFVGALVLPITFFQQNTGHYVVNEWMGIDYKHLLVLQSTDEAASSDTIADDIAKIINRIEYIGGYNCYFKSEDKTIKILYKSSEEIPDYVLYTPQKLDDEGMKKGIKDKFSENIPSGSYKIIYNRLTFKRYEGYTPSQISDGQTDIPDSKEDTPSQNTDITVPAKVTPSGSVNKPAKQPAKQQDSANAADGGQIVEPTPDMTAPAQPAPPEISGFTPLEPPPLN